MMIADMTFKDRHLNTKGREDMIWDRWNLIGQPQWWEKTQRQEVENKT